MFCSQCGQKTPENTLNCPNCGAYMGILPAQEAASKADEPRSDFSDRSAGAAAQKADEAGSAPVYAECPVYTAPPRVKQPGSSGIAPGAWSVGVGFLIFEFFVSGGSNLISAIERRMYYGGAGYSWLEIARIVPALIGLAALIVFPMIICSRHYKNRTFHLVPLFMSPLFINSVMSWPTNLLVNFIRLFNAYNAANVVNTILVYFNFLVVAALSFLFANIWLKKTQTQNR